MSGLKPTAVHIARALVKGLTDQTLEPKPVALLQQGVALLATSRGLTGPEKKALLVTAIKMVAAGPDGLPGTADDLIPPFVTAGLGALIESELLEDVADLAHAAYVQAKWLPQCMRCLQPNA